MNKKCSKCDKVCYPTEQINCLDKIWHKNCFKCTHCNLILNMKNYKGFDKQPYCAAHYPQQKPTSVDTNPELNRIKENNKFQSNIKYHQDFERSKGIFTSVADDPETRRVLENSKIISQAKYHEDFEKNIKNKCTTVCDAPELTRAIENQKLASSVEYKGIKHQNGHHTNATSSSSLPLHQNNVVMNGNHHVQTASIVSQSVQVAKYVDGERQIMTSQKVIGSIADYDPLNHENQGIGRTASVTIAKSATSSVAPRQLQHQHNLINQPDYQTRMTAYLNSDIKTSVYKAIYDYDASEEDELSFRDGDKFINCEQIDIGWMIGVHEKTGKHGMFPSNYAEPVDYF